MTKPKTAEPSRVRIRVNFTFSRKDKADVKNNPKEPRPGEFKDGNYPLGVVQIDNTQLDLMTVDSEKRRPLRPWLTVAIDISSRMIVEFSLSHGLIALCQDKCLGFKQETETSDFPKVPHQSELRDEEA